MVASKQKTSLPKNSAQGKRFSLVISRYHDDIVKELVSGATDTLTGLGAKKEDIGLVWVPGSFEIPLAARTVAQYQKVDAIICLGVIVKGETHHDRYIAHEVAHGIAMVAQTHSMPVVFGVLTTETLEQAKARAGGARGHKGIEAAETAVAMIQVLEDIKGEKKKPIGSVGFGINP